MLVINVNEILDKKSKSFFFHIISFDIDIVLRYTPVPDSILARGIAATEHASSIDSHEQKYGGFITPVSGLSTPMANIQMETIGQARNTLMNVQLSKVKSTKKQNKGKRIQLSNVHLCLGRGQRLRSNSCRSKRLFNGHDIDVTIVWRRY